MFETTTVIEHRNRLANDYLIGNLSPRNSDYIASQAHIKYALIKKRVQFMSNFTIQEIDGSNITWNLADTLARIKVEALRNDEVQNVICSKSERLDDEALPLLIDHEQLLQKISMFERAVASATRGSYLNFLSNNKYKAITVFDEDKQKYVGIAEWALPSYSDPLFQISLIDKIRILWLRVWYGLLNLFHDRTRLRLIMDEYDEAAEGHGISVKEADFVQKYGKIPYDPKTMGIYPKNLSYYLYVIGVRSDYQGRGVGALLLKKSIESFEETAKRPPMLTGAPAKLEWQSAPSARAFYTKFGCNAGPLVVTKRGLEHRAFFYDLSK